MATFRTNVTMRVCSPLGMSELSRFHGLTWTRLLCFHAAQLRVRTGALRTGDSVTRPKLDDRSIPAFLDLGEFLPSNLARRVL
jgi:hypothetical protein